MSWKFLTSSVVLSQEKPVKTAVSNPGAEALVTSLCQVCCVLLHIFETWISEQAEACVAASSASPADPTGTMRLAPAEMYGESALDVGEMWMEGLVRVVKGCHG